MCTAGVVFGIITMKLTVHNVEPLPCEDELDVSRMKTSLVMYRPRKIS